MILQACLDAGMQIPHYCYHPGLSIVASCRICLVEVEGLPKLVPSCQTPVRDGMVVHSKSPKAIANQKQVMEYLLINHPLDCPVCDQAGECYLQDYSYQYGRSQSRASRKTRPRSRRRTSGENILLYNDRCIMCTRCVRFTREVSGTSELYVDGRGHKEEIDIFPGQAAEQQARGQRGGSLPGRGAAGQGFPLQAARLAAEADAVDLPGRCRRREHLPRAQRRRRSTASSRATTPDVNQWWISDDTRYCYKPVHERKSPDAGAADAVRHAGRDDLCARRSRRPTRG